MFCHFLQQRDVTEHKLGSGFRRRSLAPVSLGGKGAATQRLLFLTQVHSDWLTSFRQTSVTFKVYPFRRDLRDNQINQLPFGVFNNNLKLTHL